MTGKLGQVVDYEIIVKNTGNISLKFGPLQDSGCAGIAGGASELGAGKETTFTCTHTLTAVGSYSNEASIEGSEGTGTKTSNKVIAKVLAEPAFTIEKLQRIAGESSFTKNEVSGKVGQVVDYEIIVKNTGNVPLKFSEFTDSNCEHIEGGPGSEEVAPGGSSTYTCVHTLSTVGPYSNQASDTGTPPAGEGFPVTHTSNTVVAKAVAEPSYTIEKLQKISGEGSYTTNRLKGKVGQVADYEIIVKNTGNVPLKFSEFSDVKCEHIEGGPGSSAVEPGASTTYTCVHTITNHG